MTKPRTDSPEAERVSHEEPALVHFGAYRLDTKNEQLWRDTQAVRLTGKAFAVLRHLASRPQELVSKRELFKAVWPETIVSQATLTSCIKELRKALADDAKTPQYIETVHRRGYRFIGDVVSSQQSVVSKGSETRNLRRETGSSSPLALGLQPSASKFVGRETELAQLHQWFARVCDGERQIVFVTGEAGIGKTTLVEVFLERLRNWELGTASLSPQSPIPNPVSCIARGQCIEQYGAGEPYMPVLEAFGRLCRGDEKEVMLALLHRYAPTWLVHMPALLSDAERDALQRQVGGATRDRMLREMAEAFEALAAETPFILCLEDLQWSDYSTSELLSVLVSRPEPAKLLILGTCRPLETLGGDHPLKKLRTQTHRPDRCHTLTPSFLSAEAVQQYLRQRFVDRVLPSGVEQLVQHHAEGNPLFMVNVVDYLEQQGVLDGDDDERVRQLLNGAAIGVPENLRQLINCHFEQMGDEEKEVLMAASVAGMEFSAATVAAGLGRDDGTIELTCADLAQRKQFLQSVGVVEWPDGTFVSGYRFTHVLYQNALYEQIPAGRRVNLHRRVGERLEQAYHGCLGEIAVELGVHFERGRDFHRAVQYLGHAAQRAMWTYAYQEAIDQLDKGIVLLSHFPESPERTQQELALQVGRSLSLMHTQGFAAPEVEQAYGRVRALSRTVGDSPQRFAALWGLRNFHLLRGELESGRVAAQEFLELVRRSEVSTLAAEAHLGLGTPLFHLGEFATARPHLEQSLSLYNPQLPQPKVFLTGQDPRASTLAHLAVLLWITGYPDQARERSRQALTMAQESGFLYGQALASNLAATLHVCCHDVPAVVEYAEAARRFAQECGFVHLVIMGMVLQGWALVWQGKREEGIRLIQTGLQRQHAAGIGIGEVSYRMLLVDAYRETGQIALALQALGDAVTALDRTGERTFEAELYRLYGELLLNAERRMQNDEHKTKQEGPDSAPIHHSSFIIHRSEEAEAYFCKAIDIAQRQQAKSLELRATVSLSRLWQQQGRRRDAYERLSTMYGWFTEGFDTADLRDAKSLLLEFGRED
ncbi:MAG: AAA family ATPase [Candidatus Binatia bacterium]